LKNQEKKIGYVWYKIEYDGKTGYVSRNAVGNLSDINFKFIVKDGLPKKLFDESKTQEDSYIVPESETKGVNVSGKLKNKVRIKDGDINLSWNIDVEEMKKQNPEIVEYNEGLERAKQGLRKSKYKLQYRKYCKT
jgi:SH3 domain protein